MNEEFTAAKSATYECPKHGDVLTIHYDSVDPKPHTRGVCSVMWCIEPVKLKKVVFHNEEK